MVKIINPKFKQSVGLFGFRFKTDPFLFLIPCLLWEKNYSFRYFFTININVMCINKAVNVDEKVQEVILDFGFSSDTIIWISTTYFHSRWSQSQGLADDVIAT